MQKILLIDDDAHLGGPLTTYLARFDLQVTQALTPSAGMALLQRFTYDAVILDVMLPEQDGFAVCRNIRALGDTPIIMLTARGDVTDRVVGLEMGADDYLPKPFEPRELAARLQSILRRQRGTPLATDAVLQFENLCIDPTERTARVNNQPLALTTSEFDTLWLLASQPGKVFHRDDILNTLHGHYADVFTRAVDITISRLRKKLQPLQAIKTVRNAGYQFTLKPRP